MSNNRNTNFNIKISKSLEKLAWVPILLILTAIIVARVAGLRGSFVSLPLTLILSFIFYTLVSLFTLFLLGRSFLKSGAPSLLLLECGVLLWCLSGTVGDAVSHGNANINATIFNIGIFWAALCHLTGVTKALRPQRVFRNRVLWLGVGCALTLGILCLVTWAALTGCLPVFFITGHGGTTIRYCVLILAISMFILSAGLLYAGQRKDRLSFTSWYAYALLLMAVGLFGIMIQLSIGSVVNWLARSAQWLGGVYLLLAAITALTETGIWKFSLTTVEEAWQEHEFRLSHYKRTFIILTLLITGLCAFLFYTFYEEAKNTAITKLNEEQMIHAKQAAQGIEDFFAMWTRILTSLSKMDEVINNDAMGKRDMKLYYESHQGEIKSIVRLDERGVILYNYPINNFVGKDISYEKHIRALLRDHKPIISEVFKSVEGFNAIAIYVPVFKGMVFKGSIGILINFEKLAKRYLDVIKIGETGYAWVLSRDGTFIYCPVIGFTGTSAFKSVRDFPSLIDMMKDMLKGHIGSAKYTFDRVGVRKVGQTTKYAVYMPIHIGNTFWSIAVTSAEQDVFSGLISFRDKLIFIIGALFIFGMVFSTLGAKAWFIVKEEERRRQAEKKLHESEQIAEKFSTLFHAAPFATALATIPKGTLYDVNQAWLDLAGYSRKEDVIGKTILGLGLISKTELKEHILNELQQHGSVRNAEIKARTKAGIQCILLVSLEIVDIGRRKFILSAIQDITERKNSENKLKSLNENLDQFAYVASHDLQEPLRVMSSFSQLLKKRYKNKFDKDAEEFIDFIVDAANRMQGLITDLLAYSRVGRQGIVLSEVDLNETIKKVIHGMRLTIEQSDGEVTYNNLPVLIAHETSMTQLFQNLISNAVKYRKTESPRVHISSNKNNGVWVFAVADNGIGIESQHFERIFQMFQRLHSKQEYSGTGIGLAICKKIVTNCGGKIWVESQIGKGSTFYFSIPENHKYMNLEILT